MDYRVIKDNDVFLMTNQAGDIPADDMFGLGLYTKDTRFLSQMEIYINGKKPVLLSSAADENYVATIRLTNVHMEEDGVLELWRESIEIERKRLIYEGGLYEQISLTNYFPKELTFTFSAQFSADFYDMFIVRGFRNAKRGVQQETMIAPSALHFLYEGADGVQRETRVQWDKRETSAAADGNVLFTLTLQPKQTERITFFIAPCINGEGPSMLPLHEAESRLEASYDTWNRQSAQVTSDLPLFNQLYHRGLQDLRVLLTDLGYGRFPVAGLPWFAVPFGRDSLIAALQMLPANTEVARGTLQTMAAYQGQTVDPWREEQPGKIMHEIRYGELANTNQIPFTPYYGTVDATPLFLVLAAEYYHWTGDLELIASLLPQIEAALSWIETYGDRDGDGFVEYYQESSKGIANQGWKDSGDSIVHETGDYAKAPIALVEVQGYVYQAQAKLAPILRQLGREELAAELEQRASALKERFEAAFWMEEEQFYAIALDQEKQQVRSVTSNPGHILMSGLVNEERAAQIAKRLISPDLFSGYGIRTMGTQSAGYNPMSYHDGSVWPHDNSLCLLGLSVSGFREEAQTVMSGLLRAAEGFEYYRLPELFCGYDTSLGHPVPYPVACSPQAWAAGTPLVMLQAMLGLQPNALDKHIRLQPVLPEGMNHLRVEHVYIGEGILSLEVLRDGEALRVHVAENTTGYTIVLSE